MASYVLDTSAVLSALKNEPGRDRVERLLEDARVHPEAVSLILPFMVLMEVEYRLRREGINESRVESVLALVADWPAMIVESDEVWRRRAALVKATNRLSVADAWVASLALLLNAAVVHKDPELDKVPGLQSLRL